MGSEYEIVPFRGLVYSEVKKLRRGCMLKELRKLIPKIEMCNLPVSQKSGIRPQLINKKSKRMEMNFVLESSPLSCHVLNAISSAFTSSFAFSEYVAGQIKSDLGNI